MREVASGEKTERLPKNGIWLPSVPTDRRSRMRGGSRISGSNREWKENGHRPDEGRRTRVRPPFWLSSIAIALTRNRILRVVVARFTWHATSLSSCSLPGPHGSLRRGARDAATETESPSVRGTVSRNRAIARIGPSHVTATHGNGERGDSEGKPKTQSSCR